jgi:hypothetical protein
VTPFGPGDWLRNNKTNGFASTGWSPVEIETIDRVLTLTDGGWPKYVNWLKGNSKEKLLMKEV